MTFDATPQELNAPRPQWRLPNVLDMQINRVPYQAPRLRYFESYLSRYTEAIEFLITTDGPFPVRALSPVLYVGNVAVTESEGVQDNQYRFLAFEFDQLEEGAPISLGWSGQPQKQRLRTGFRYRSPDRGRSRARRRGI